MSENIMSEEKSSEDKGSRWDNDAHIRLCTALDQALAAAGSTPAKHQELIMECMAGGSHSYTWQGVRHHIDTMVKWDDKATADLFLSMMAVVCPSLNEEQKTAITAEMQKRGYDVVWNGIR